MGLEVVPESDGDAPQVERPKVDLQIDWSQVNLDEVILPEDDDLGIRR